MMDNTAPDTILVVSEREFRVDRKILVENVPYFRGMFQGGFRESREERVELKDISDGDAFAVLLDYVLNKRVNLKEMEEILPSVLALCEMLCFDEFLDFMKREVFAKWSDLGTAKTILHFADALNVRTPLWSHILTSLRNAFRESGDIFTLEETLAAVRNADPERLSPTRFVENCLQNSLQEIIERNSELGSGVSTIASTDLVVDILGTEETSTLCFWDIEKDVTFVPSLISWILDRQLPQASIRRLLGCFGTYYQDENLLMEFIDMKERIRGLYMVKPEVQNFVTNTKECLKNLDFRLCVTRFNRYYSSMQLFNFQNCNWEFFKTDKLLVKPNVLCTRPSCTGEAISEDFEVKTHFWCSPPKEFVYSFFGNVSASDHNQSNKTSPMYTSAQHATDGTYILLVFEFESGAKVFSEVFRAQVPGPILGCELLRLEDVLHGFLTYKGESSAYNVCHFALHRDAEERTWYNADFHLEVLLPAILRRYVPFATSVSKEGAIVLVLRCLKDLFITEYNLECGFLKPLRHDRVFPFERGPPNVPGHREEHEAKHKKVCTIYVACCSDDTRPIHKLFTVEGKGRHCFTPSFLRNFDSCAKHDNHVPQLKSIMHICETL